MAIQRSPRQHRHLSRQNNSNKHLPLRNILNTIFMALAVVGVAIYYFGSDTIGIIIVLVAMVVKMVECAIRLFFHS